MQILVAEAVKSKSAVLVPEEGPNLSGDEMPFWGHLFFLIITASFMRPELSRPNLKSHFLISQWQLDFSMTSEGTFKPSLTQFMLISLPVGVVLMTTANTLEAEAPFPLHTGYFRPSKPQPCSGFVHLSLATVAQ